MFKNNSNKSQRKLIDLREKNVCICMFKGNIRKQRARKMRGNICNTQDKSGHIFGA